MAKRRQFFAVVPAAGESRRMGRAKLLLPVGEKTVIARLLDVLDREEVSTCCVVIRPGDKDLRAAMQSGNLTVVEPPIAPPDMRASVQYALDEIEQRFSPADDDGWLLLPADHPVLSANVIDQLITYFLEHDTRILVPTFEGRRGHPTLLRWELAQEVAMLPANKGLNLLVQNHADSVVELPVDDPAVLTDLDTPADYNLLLARWQER